MPSHECIFFILGAGVYEPLMKKCAEFYPRSFILTQDTDLEIGLPVVGIHGNCQSEIYTLIKRRPFRILVIGTTLQSPTYLRKFISKAKRFGGRVVHINPDDGFEKEIWEQLTTEDGLRIFLGLTSLKDHPGTTLSITGE